MRGLVAITFAFVAIEVLFSVPALSWNLLRGREGLSLGVGCAAAAAAFVVIVLLRGRILAVVRRCAERAASVPAGAWLLTLLLAGSALRIAWVAAFPAPPTSDAATYVELAKGILAGKPYLCAGTRAYWPPGYPAFLAPWLALPVPDRWAIVLMNLALFGASLATVPALARRIAGEGAARLAGALLAVWPNLVTQAGIAMKEQLLLVLLPLSILLFARERLRWATFAGLILGTAALVQPSLLVFAPVFVLHEIARRAPLRKAALRLALVGVAMAVAIAPWTIRNHRVFGEFVLLTTNGGDNLYRANNPLATGGYMAREQRFDGYGELEASRLGYAWAREWVAAHPGDFVRLALRKQALLLGDDSVGVYETLRRGLGRGGIAYLAPKSLANVFWLALWAVILSAILVGRSASFAPSLSVTLGSGFLCFWVVHSVFESGGKYHVPALGMLLALAAALGSRLPRLPEETEPSQSLIRTFFAFAGVGAIATGIQYVTLALLVELLDAAPAASSAVGFGISSLVNYGLNYRLTFRSTAPHGVALPKFVAVALVGLALNTILMRVLAERWGVYYLLAQVITTGLVLLWNFAANLLWSFRKPGVAPVRAPAPSPQEPVA